jgi:hypothetical protein
LGTEQSDVFELGLRLVEYLKISRRPLFSSRKFQEIPGRIEMYETLKTFGGPGIGKNTDRQSFSGKKTQASNRAEKTPSPKLSIIRDRVRLPGERFSKSALSRSRRRRALCIRML